MKTELTDDIQLAAEYILKGELVAFPTETVYGLGANIFDDDAVEKIFKVKGRPEDNPLIVHVASNKDIRIVASHISESARMIINEFFPGPVTIILPKNDIVSDIVTAGLDTIAVRAPALKITRDFIKEVGLPIAAPSANISGSPSPTTFQHVIDDLHGKIPCVLIGKETKYGLESTVVDCTVDPPEILRPGVVTIEELRKVDRDIKLKTTAAQLKSPGQRYKHYSPMAKIKIKDITEVNKTKYSSRTAFIGLHSPTTQFDKVQICKTPMEYGKKLFSFFRQCDYDGYETIIAEKITEKGIGLAIMNRLKKAAQS